MQTEQKLIKRIKKKQDKEAANTLISYYYKEVYAYVYRQTGNEELAKWSEYPEYEKLNSAIKNISNLITEKKVVN